MRKEVLYVIFLDLTKAYDALDRSRSLEILEEYGVGPRVRRLLRTYWGKSMMVARAGGYYGNGFKGARGVTQATHCHPPSSTWWWMRWFATGLRWQWRRHRRGGRGGRKAGTRPPSSTWTTAW